MFHKPIKIGKKKQQKNALNHYFMKIVWHIEMVINRSFASIELMSYIFNFLGKLSTNLTKNDYYLVDYLSQSHKEIYCYFHLTFYSDFHLFMFMAISGYVCGGTYIK